MITGMENRRERENVVNKGKFKPLLSRWQRYFLKDAKSNDLESQSKRFEI